MYIYVTNRQSSSTTNLRKEKKQATGLQKNQKKNREKQARAILVEQASTWTLFNEDANQMTFSLQQTPATNKSKE